MRLTVFNPKRVKLFAITLVATTFAIAGCAKGFNTAAASDAALIEQAAASSTLTVFRSPTCGCCSKWIDHMEAAGFKVEDNVTEDMDAVKQQYGVPATMTSCHTTVANGYAIEGHIPAADVARLLVEKPDVAGIAVPGMPIGSPGMESGDYTEPYTVFSFSEDGTTTTFSNHS